MQTLRRQFMAKILVAEVHIFILQFAGLSGMDYNERIRDGDPKKEYTGRSWSTYFQARAGALQRVHLVGPTLILQFGTVWRSLAFAELRTESHVRSRPRSNLGSVLN